ncbi:L-xylulose reductase-like [Tribolium madens]|uniref:L-xylulose reductase-like n=1 Tax=Tribolium madens TaxID=41895 RepID=UPI001CF75496|nr:L-xylulose reductase-like [Tribolium madens]
MEITFHGKRALVTGASQGIGRDIAIQLAKCGAEVIAVARNQQLLNDLKREFPSISPISVDLTDWKATQKALSNMGPIDLLVNNAGIVILKPVPEFSEEDYDRLFDTNVKALVNVTQIVTKQLLERGAPGAIVNVSSQTAKVGLEKHAVYCGTKGAVDAYTRGVALELGPHNIRVNCVNPTVIMTEMGKIGYSDKRLAEKKIAKIPLRRFGEVREVTDAVLFLLSDKASMITGETLLVDGGYVHA